MLLATDRPLRLGRARRSSACATGCAAAPSRCSELPQRLLRERDRIVGTLGPRWKRALAGHGRAAGRSTTRRCSPRWRRSARTRGPALVLLAFCAAQLLAQIPITPGGLGFVEAGLTATLALAGVSAGDAVLATFAYRLFSYWLPLPAGAVGMVLHRRRLASGAHVTLSRSGRLPARRQLVDDDARRGDDERATTDGKAGNTPTCRHALSAAKKIAAQRAQPCIANSPKEARIITAPRTRWNQPHAVKSQMSTPERPPTVTTWR